MIRTFVATVVLCVAAMTAQADTMQVHSPEDQVLNLRSGPGVDFRIITGLPHGTYVITHERSGDWVYVTYQGAEFGWVHSKYLRNPLENKDLRLVSSPDGMLNLRTGPGTSFGIMAELHNGEQAEIIERKGGWARVLTFGHETGWVYEKYLK